MVQCEGVKLNGDRCRSTWSTLTNRGYFCQHHIGCESYREYRARMGRREELEARQKIIRANYEKICLLMRRADMIAVRIYMSTFVCNAQHLIRLTIGHLGKYYASIVQNAPQTVDAFVQKHFPGVMTAREFEKFTTFLKLLVTCYRAKSVAEIRQQIRQYAVHSFSLTIMPQVGDILNVFPELDVYGQLGVQYKTQQIASFDALDHLLTQTSNFYF
jgi:hypothetical protein